MTEQAKRISGERELNDQIPCYWRDYDSSEWYLYLPYCGVGRLNNHCIEEHIDGTISVTPSILMSGHKEGTQTQRHGYLTKGVWNEC